jgi:hypothetical protein
MSLFDFPRINVKGIVELRPGTANNDDYAGAVTLPANWGPFAGQTLALSDSKLVEARTYGMSDDQFIAWVQKAQPFSSSSNPCKTQMVIPAEWNYYGDMSSQVLSATVVGVQTGPHQLYSTADGSVPLTSLIGSSLTFSGGITDVNSEGSPPATQFFIDRLTLLDGTAKAIDGVPSKGACQWLNFYRNINLTADGGAGGYVYHILRKDQPGAVIDLPGFEDPDIIGVIFRYYLYRPMQKVQGNDNIEQLYKNKDTNASTIEFIATIAPLRANEQIVTGPTGRLLIANSPTIPTPQGTQNNGGGTIALAPAVLQLSGNLLSAEFSGTFPDYYQQTTNDKYDFGPVTLVVDGSNTTATIATVPYADTAGGNARGWMFDFDLSQNQAALTALQDPNASFRLVHATWGTILGETDYYFVSNQQAIYAEQHGPGDRFLNQGTEEPATVAVYHRGRLLSRSDCPPVTLWQYRSIPLQDPGNAVALDTQFRPGDPIVVDTSQPGNYLFTFTALNPNATPPAVPPAGFPPKSYSTFMNPPWLTNAPSISLRILPNNEDFSRYYVDPTAAEPVGNDQLTFDVVYRHVLRTYYLLYPAMNKYIPLNSEPAVKPMAQRILDFTEKALWMTIDYMPRTRDMSESRRKLLRAWCLKVR